MCLGTELVLWKMDFNMEGDSVYHVLLSVLLFKISVLLIIFHYLLLFYLLLLLTEETDTVETCLDLPAAADADSLQLTKSSLHYKNGNGRLM